uniref:Alkylglycerone-phosphate synthase n=1 Tax=Romanomermis culicivorax TaxID=13658 RepID=A0A915JXK6_ROMCU
MDPKVNTTTLEDRKRDHDLKWNGWGYSDSYFFVNDKGTMQFNGKRYEMGGKTFPGLIKWMQSTLNMDIEHSNFGRDKIDESKIPSPILNSNFIEFLKLENIAHSSDGLKRVHRSHGHTVEDMIKLRLGTCESRIPDIVVWPTCHEDVIKIVRAANEFDVVIIPIGGGTSVSEALKCPENENRCIISLDTNDMNKILWLDEKNLLAKAQGGILGIDLEKQLNDRGFTLGHEPDSIEFSSLGGWVATRASGIKKNKYGNIEDILVHVTFVTSKGVIQKSCMAPRISSGPDIHHMIIGSEGTLGVVTEVTFKICPLPQCKKFGSVLFPTFEKGVEALREIAKEKIAPASIRLMDNEQFKFGQALKTSSSFVTSINDFLKRLYVTQWKRFDANKMAPATIVFEGNNEEVEMQEKRVYSICGKYDGFPAGEENGRYGYQLTFSIAYLRDVGMNYMAIGESFETSVPWD